MRISDWSSDVCSSDLFGRAKTATSCSDCIHCGADSADFEIDEVGIRHNVVDVCHENGGIVRTITDEMVAAVVGKRPTTEFAGSGAAIREIGFAEIGRASCRERVCQYV